MKNERIRIGLAGAVHSNMPGDDAGAYTAAIDAVEKLSKTMDFDLSVFRKPLSSEEDGRVARDFMDGEKVDFTLVFNASLPFGRVILPLARVRSFLGLWSIPEPSTSGVLQLNSFCGTNMLGAIIGNYLREYDIPFKWFYGRSDEPRFLERFDLTLRAMRAIKALSTSRIGQIGGLANGFENMYVDERVLEKKFGTVLQSRHSVEEIVARAEKFTDAEVARDIESMGREGKLDMKLLDRTQVEKSARVHLALAAFARDNDYDALALSCWSRFQEVYGIAVCGAMSRMNQDGIVTPCEADVASAVTMLLLNALNGQKAALSDLVAFDEADSSLCLWHCGVAPSSWADDRGVVWDNHFNIGKYEGCAWCGDGVVADMRFRAGPVTISAMNNDFDDLLILTGNVMKKPGYSGSGGWVNGLRLNGRETGIADLMETIVDCRVNHHYASAFGDLTGALNEFASWKGVSVLDKIGYKPYLSNPRKIRDR
jgi:L-fucose isomerase-like protein